METGHTPEKPSFVNDFSRAMQLCADSQSQAELQKITRTEYVRIFCVAIIAASIAEDRLTGVGPSGLLTTEDLGLKFENAEPITLPSILEKGVRTAGYTHFGFGSLDDNGGTFSPDQPGYTRILRRFGFGHFQNNSDGMIMTGDELLRALLENDQRIVFVPRLRKENYRK